MRTIVAATAPVGFALGATEVTMTAFAADHGSRAAAGALMAAWAAGSGIGGLTYGGREHASAPGRALGAPGRALPAVLAAAPARAVDRWPWRRWPSIAGLCLAPYMAAANQLVGDVAPAGAVTEAFAWPITAIGLGAAGGSAVAGAIAQSWGWRPGFGGGGGGGRGDGADRAGGAGDGAGLAGSAVVRLRLRRFAASTASPRGTGGCGGRGARGSVHAGVCDLTPAYREESRIPPRCGVCDLSELLVRQVARPPEDDDERPDPRNRPSPR